MLRDRVPARYRASGTRGERELSRGALARPASVVEQRTPVLELTEDLGERMLHRLVGTDCPSEGMTLLGVGNRHLQRGLDAAERLSRDQRLR